MSEVGNRKSNQRSEVGSPKFNHAALSLNGQKSEIWSSNFVKSELVPAILYSLYLTLCKTDTSVKRTLRVGPCHSLLLYLTLYKTDTSVKRTLRVGPCLSLLPLFDSL